MSMQEHKTRTIIENERFKQIAETLKPDFYKEEKSPEHVISTYQDDDAIHGWNIKSEGEWENNKEQAYGKNASFIVDFADHMVGYVTLSIKPVGSPPDAPLHLKLTFGEMPVEVSEPFDQYDGWLSSSWLQEEFIHVDVMPTKITLPRRYSFRYLKMSVLDTSPKYKVVFDQIACETITSADLRNVPAIEHTDPELAEIDRISVKTLADCMQDVFEDGPKRDRRLWLGDLRLQALANYETVQNNDLVKRCLYLFAAVPNQKGEVSANLFIEPKLIADDTYLFDYSLFFTTTLYDYFQATNDSQTLQDLWPTALAQVENALDRLSEDNIVIDDPSWWSFIDWQEQLNKQAASQAILIYALKKATKMAKIVADPKSRWLEEQITTITNATIKKLWDEEQGFFISGEDNQVSWASQIWMVIAGVFDKEKNKKLLHHLFTKNPTVGINTPYMYHHLVEALVISDERELAIKYLKDYWGTMVDLGADTFWELFNPKDPAFSPYGSHLINSYCHAWSCTPTYLIRKYNL